MSHANTKLTSWSRVLSIIKVAKRIAFVAGLADPLLGPAPNKLADKNIEDFDDENSIPRLQLNTF